jgi:hypothetical protein
MENISRIVQGFPTFGQMGLYYEGTRLNPRADFVPHERIMYEAQSGMGLGVGREMGIKVGRIRAPGAQDTTTLRLSRFRPPERRGGMDGPGRQRHTSSETGLQQLAAA